jgi:hypothetical protein
VTNPGGFLEQATTAIIRERPNVPLPDVGPFQFPAPYSTIGIRITSPYGGADGLLPCAYSYWQNMNAHDGHPVIRIFLGTDRNRGGVGPALWELDKATDAVEYRGPLFPPEHPLSWQTGEGWYWSRHDPDVLYCSDLSHLYRLHVTSGELETVVVADPSAVYWQWHTADDERRHSATIKNSSSYAVEGVGVFVEGEAQPWTIWYPTGQLDECQIDKSGQWLLVKEQIDAEAGEDNRIIRLVDARERTLLDQDGAAGHSDNGFGYMIAADNWNEKPAAIRVWAFDHDAEPQGTLVYHSPTWDSQIDHVSHCNARNAAPAGQYALGSGASRNRAPRTNEILGFRLDGSLEVLVVAPVLTDLDVSGGRDDYANLPKGNLDTTGQYFLWTSNHGTERLDAFVVKVPSHLLTGGTPGPTPPTCTHCPVHCPTTPPPPVCTHCAVHCPG